ncbi:MAG TPA: peptide chain release factor 3 [Gaiellaceae bacterium]|nr:peptide chain release factor 3 [Gaiellaceae bacterium]
MEISSAHTRRASRRLLETEAERRRTFAIISHPDAGKTTLTEKLLLYAGAVAEAGAVRARRNGRAVVSDWMQIERERGISVTATVLRFTHNDTILNLLDTPGHRDFSEDTYRVLSAADAAVVLLDAAKGVEEQTLKLFEVARARGLPLITFVNKLDRPSRDPLELLDEIEQTLGLEPVPLTWPVGTQGDFEGVIDRVRAVFVRYRRSAGGATAALEEVTSRSALAHTGNASWAEADEQLALLDQVRPQLDRSAFLAGRETPVFFGSAISNFGVRLLLEALIEHAPTPHAQIAADGSARELDSGFSGFVFKIQANMNLRHRDRVAFVRVCSGRLETGMKATNARSGRQVALSHAQELFGRDRESLSEAFPGDVIGLVNCPGVRIGDTLYVGEPVQYPPLPVLAPERFVVVRNRDSRRYKQFQRGLAELELEGVVHVLRRPDRGDQEPILAGVGDMQFEVTTQRLRDEYGALVDLEPAPFRVARRTDAEGARALGAARGVVIVERSDETPFALFESQFHLDRVTAEHPNVVLEAIVTS